MRARRATSVQQPSESVASLVSLLTAWGPEFRGLGRLLLLRRPDRLARLVQLGRDRLHLGRDAVERFLHAQVVANAVGAALLDELVDLVLVLACRAQLLA